MPEIAKHPGTVICVADGSVRVLITTLSACGSCEAHAHCGFTESRDNEIVVDTPDWQHYQPGQHVVVSVNEGMGLAAVWWAYICPAILLLTATITLLYTISSEPLAVLISLTVVAVYYIVLFLFRRKLQRQFSFGISDAP